MAKNEICWFCEERRVSLDPRDYSEVKVFRDVSRHNISRKKTRISWEEKSIVIPRCKKCRTVAQMNIPRYGLTFISFSLGMLVISPRNWDITQQMILSFGIGILVYFLGKFFVSQFAGPGVLKKKLLEHPLVVAEVKNGWDIHNPGASIN